MIRKKKGFVLLPVVLATFIMGMLGIGLASMYSGTFSTMNAGKAASKAKDFATIEGNYVKLNGYDTASSMTHDWESLSDLVGPDATGWQSKVETSSTATSADGNQVKVMKVAVKKDSDIASRYTYEVPVVQGKDSYTKAEIDAMMSVVNGNFTKVNNRIDAMIEDTNNIKTQINNLYADMDSLNKNLDKLHTLVENYRTSLLNSINGVQGNLDAEIAARKAADASESSARQSADNALNKRCDNIDGKIKDLQGALSNTQERVKSLEGRVSSLEGRTKNLEDRASALESGLDAETKARIAADKSITDELHSVRDNLTEKYKALKTSVDDIGGKVKNMSKDVKANTDNIASINELLKNSFVFNGKHNTGISLAYDATQKKMRAYYNGQEVPLGSQGGANISVQTSTSNVVKAVLYGNYGRGSDFEEGDSGIYGDEYSYLTLTAVKVCTYPVTHKKMRLDADGETAFIDLSDTNGSGSTFDLGLSHEWFSHNEADTFFNQCYDWVRAQIKAKYPQYTSIDIENELTDDGQEDLLP